MNDKRFSGIAGQEYDLRAKAVPHHEAMQQLVGQMIAKCLSAISSIEPAPLILELGCGTGSTTYKILSQCPDATIHAVDNEKVMLDQANSNLHYGA